MARTSSPASNAPAAAAPAVMTATLLAARLGSLLDSFSGAYEAMGTLAATHREAVRTADTRGVERANAAQGALVNTLAELEQQRRELVAACCTRFAPLAGKRTTAITLTDLCGCVPSEQRAAMLAKAGALKQLIHGVDAQTRSLKAATASLAAHMEGLMRQVGRQLSHAGTYTARGFVEPGGIVVSALDLST